MANAGIINLEGSAAVSVSDYDKHFAINTRGVFFGVQAISPLIRAGGNIIVTSSLAATKVLPQHTLYAGSKAAMAAFARNWAIEFKERKIRVNILSPGPTETEILGKLGVTDADRPGFEAQHGQPYSGGKNGTAGGVGRGGVVPCSQGHIRQRRGADRRRRHVPDLILK